MTKMKKPRTYQSKFNEAMRIGRSVTLNQVARMGFANVYDAAYKARQFYGMNVATHSAKGKATRYSLVY